MKGRKLSKSKKGGKSDKEERNSYSAGGSLSSSENHSQIRLHHSSNSDDSTDNKVEEVFDSVSGAPKLHDLSGIKAGRGLRGSLANREKNNEKVDFPDKKMRKEILRAFGVWNRKKPSCQV